MDRFNTIFTKVFPTSKKAIVYCQNLARLCGFSVRIRTSKTTTIYIVCSREGLPEQARDLNKKRSRNSDRCNCDWRIVLYKRSQDQWEYRSGKTMEHNHIIYSSEDYLEAEDKPIVNTHQDSPCQMSSPTQNASSPLPSIRSLDLPYPVSNGTISPDSDSSIPSWNHKPDLMTLPPLTKALAKIMCPLPQKQNSSTSLSYLLN